MTLVHGFDTYSAVEFAEETTWGTAATTGWIRVGPLVAPGDQLRLERDALQRAREMGFGGEPTTYGYGGARVVGSFSFLPSYNSTALGKLQKHALGQGTEATIPNALPNGSTPGGTPSGYATHMQWPSGFGGVTAGWEGGISKGLTIRVWKSGPDDTGKLQTYAGCIPIAFLWDQGEERRPVVTVTFIGKSLQTSNASGLTPAALQTGLVPIGVRDFMNRPTQPVCPGISKVNSALALDWNLRSFRINIEGQIEPTKPFLNSLDAMEKPVHVGKWKVTGSAETLLEQTFGVDSGPGTRYPSLEHEKSEKSSKIRLRYVSDTNAYDGGSEANRAPYVYDFLLTNVIWRDVRHPVADFGAIRQRLEFETATGDTGTSNALLAPIVAMILIQSVGGTTAY